MAFRPSLLLSAAVGVFLSLSGAVSAESLKEALASAYANNPELNSARAGVRVADEYVPQALAKGRPTLNASITAGLSGSNTNARIGGMLWADTHENAAALSGELVLVQPIYAGGRIENGVRSAESSVKAAREQLRAKEQSTLFNAAGAYMDVIYKSEVLALRQSNVAFLKEQVRAANDRFSVGEGTRTDVSQAQAALAAATASVSVAQADLLSAKAVYVNVIGHEPKNLRDPGPISRLVPGDLSVAVNASRSEHPGILAAIHNADTAVYNVSISEGALLPSLGLQATVGGKFASLSSSSGDSKPTADRAQNIEGTLGLKLSIPIYQGGGEYSAVRQAKEQLGKARLDVDTTRMAVDAMLMQSWSTLESAKAQIVAAQAAVTASQLALDGVIEEQKVGQRTTLDVLNAQSTLIQAKLSEAGAQTQLVVASYGVVSAMGRLDRERLGLEVAAYKPEAHYGQVRDKWFGLRTPDGR